jgi:UDP-N-acetylmuramyl tripeptide synthase
MSNGDSLEKDFKRISITGTREKEAVAALLWDVLEALGYRRSLFCIEPVEFLSLRVARPSSEHVDVGVCTNLIPEDLGDAWVETGKVLSGRVLSELAQKFVINADDAVINSVMEKFDNLNLVRYGMLNTEKCNLYADRLLFSNDGVTFDLVYRHRKEDEEFYMQEQGHAPIMSRINVFLSVPGQFAVYKVLAVVGVCIQLGIDINRIAPIFGEGNTMLEGRDEHENEAS